MVNSTREYPLESKSEVSFKTEAFLMDNNDRTTTTLLVPNPSILLNGF